MGIDFTADDGSELRFNWSGMRRVRDDLERFDVIVHAESPPFPDPLAFGLADWPDDDAPDLTSGERRFLAAVDAVAAATMHGDTHGLPSYKFDTNDGWMVTRGEIAVSLGWADHHHDGWRDDIGVEARRFVAWAESVGRNGFKVT